MAVLSLDRLVTHSLSTSSLLQVRGASGTRHGGGFHPAEAGHRLQLWGILGRLSGGVLLLLLWVGKSEVSGLGHLGLGGTREET